jgi:hypothetical protein
MDRITLFNGRRHGGSLATNHYFFGRRCVSWHRLQRVFCELIIPPHFGQRRFFSFMTWLVRGRIPMTIFSPVSTELTLRTSVGWHIPVGDWDCPLTSTAISLPVLSPVV